MRHPIISPPHQRSPHQAPWPDIQQRPQDSPLSQHGDRQHGLSDWRPRGARWLTAGLILAPLALRGAAAQQDGTLEGRAYMRLGTYHCDTGWASGDPAAQTLFFEQLREQCGALALPNGGLWTQPILGQMLVLLETPMMLAVAGMQELSGATRECIERAAQTAAQQIADIVPSADGTVAPSINDDTVTGILLGLLIIATVLAAYGRGRH